MKLLALSVFVTLAPACALEDPAAEATVESGLLCSPFLCGDNAPTNGDGFLFDELDLFGRPNYAGVRIDGARPPVASGWPEPVTFGVTRHFMYVIDAWGERHEGLDLVGTIIRLKHDESNVEVEVLIANVNESSIAFAVGVIEELPTYELRARTVGTTEKFERYVCTGDPLLADPAWTSVPHHALVYRGDRYHPTEKRLIENNPKDGWIFLGCAGSGGAKMHLNRHTHAGGYIYSDGDSVIDYPTTLAERTTFMKALTADYCGNGSSRWTIFGQPLRYAADQPWFGPTGVLDPAVTRTTEGLWDEDGVVCLDKPRRALRKTVVESCGWAIPKCNSVTNWATRAYAITTNPW